MEDVAVSPPTARQRMLPAPGPCHGYALVIYLNGRDQLLFGAWMNQNLSEDPPALTRMQLECLRRAASTDKEIARLLSISPDTVSVHIRAAMRRLGASNRREAMGLLTVHPLYGSIDIPGVQIVVANAEASQASRYPTAPRARPSILGWQLPPLPGTIGRISLVVGVFVGLTGLMIVGLSLLLMAAALIDRQAPSGSL